MPLPIETGPDDLRPHPRHTGRHGLDLVLALAAIFISIVSLFVALEHGRLEGKLLAASTWPFLQELHEGDQVANTDTVTVVNAGVGPLKLVSLRMFLDGRPVPNIAAFGRQCCGMTAAEIGKRFVSSNVENSVLRPGQDDLILRYSTDPADPDLNDMERRAAERMVWDACYCSVFDECWRSTLSNLTPRPVARCEPPTDSFNQGFFARTHPG
ncbi:MAG: hypothetical protein INR65_18505 [Gluconacetobacter diazotrophicus]|nr:hypothetical protein [Gluconacetobacter diazotrophicus]